MITHYSDNSLRMPVTSSSSTKYIRDPALRSSHPEPDMTDELWESTAAARYKYEQSEIKLPSIWSWERLPRVHSYESSIRSWNQTKLAHDTKPYYPFDKELYTIATTDLACDWSHVVHADNKESECSYSWPCGCESPTIEYKVLRSLKDVTTAVIANNENTLYHLVPRMPVFAQGALPKKKKKRKRGISLTDTRTYSRLVRARRQSSAHISNGCSKQLQEPESD